MRQVIFLIIFFSKKQNSKFYLFFFRNKHTHKGEKKWCAFVLEPLSLSFVFVKIKFTILFFRKKNLIKRIFSVHQATCVNHRGHILSQKKKVINIFMNNYGISTKLVGVIINQDTIYRIIKIILAAKKKCIEIQ